jgi:hypothetical protein
MIGIGMKKKEKISAINSVKVIVSPWQKGFTCGIIMDSKSKMSTEQYELCSTIARGMLLKIKRKTILCLSVLLQNLMTNLMLLIFLNT